MRRGKVDRFGASLTEEEDGGGASEDRAATSRRVGTKKKKTKTKTKKTKRLGNCRQRETVGRVFPRQ